MNKRGYLLSELIICFALSFVILIVIFNTTINLNQKLNDLFVENKANSQQIIFNRKIGNDFSTKTVTGMSFDETSRTCTITYSTGPIDLVVTDEYIVYNNEKISIPNNMKIESVVTCKIDDNGIAKLKIPIKYAKQKKDYGIELYSINTM